MAPSWDPSTETIFISLVQNHPNLWQKTHPDYSNTYCKSKTYDEIAKTLDKTKTEVQKKWKTLKRRMDNEVRNLPKCRSGDGANDIKSKWIHFQSMSFMLGEMEYKKPSGNLSALSAKVEKDSEYDDDSDEDEEINMPVKNKVGTKEKILLYSGESKKCIDTVTGDNTEDMNFFSQMLDDVRKIKPEKRMRFQQEVSDVVWKYAYGNKFERTTKPIDDDIEIIEPKQRRVRRSCPAQTGCYQPQMAQVQPWTDWKQMPYQLPIKREDQQRPATSLGDVTNNIPMSMCGHLQIAQPVPPQSPAVPLGQISPNVGNLFPGPTRNTNSIPTYYCGLPQAAQPAAAVAQRQIPQNDENQYPGSTIMEMEDNYRRQNEHTSYTEFPSSTSQPQ